MGQAAENERNSEEAVVADETNSARGGMGVAVHEADLLTITEEDEAQ